ncbi:hypothetical protein ARMSODRAFT_975644 [Armillaria solidipes]|uniref:Uncharacterized protein n=1 Tax=Armillaria solidipes TaxID=1076256 RepID=A0A2H3BD35_9AGAR|nr:hypothetical protein ARMSODRAFT_975644 [Armillaria solidipes]
MIASPSLTRARYSTASPLPASRCFRKRDLFRPMYDFSTEAGWLIFIQGLFLSMTCVRSQTSYLRTIRWRPPTSQTLIKRTTKHLHPTIASLKPVTNPDEPGITGKASVNADVSSVPLEVSGESLTIIPSSGIGCHQLPYSTVPSLIFLLPAPYLEEFGDHRIDYDSRRLIHSAYSLINITAIASTTIFLLFAFCDLVARLYARCYCHSPYPVHDKRDS